MKKLNGILWGVVFIAIGALFALNALDITNVNVFFDGWWSLLIIIPCAIELISGNDRIGSFVCLCIGVLLLLAAQDVISFALVLKLAAPAAFILIGIKIIYSALFARKNAAKIVGSGKKPKHIAVFSGEDANYSGMEFESAELIAVFGGVTCDLRNAIITKDVSINVCCAFGGVDLFLPDNVQVKTSAVSLFGGVENAKQNALGGYTVYINGSCIFGGVDIK